MTNSETPVPDRLTDWIQANPRAAMWLLIIGAWPWAFVCILMMVAGVTGVANPQAAGCP